VISLSLISQGDSDCHAYDLSSMEKVATYVGHGDYLHAVVALDKTQRIATASEGSRPLCSFVHPALRCHIISAKRDHSSPGALLQMERCGCGIHETDQRLGSLSHSSGCPLRTCSHPRGASDWSPVAGLAASRCAWLYRLFVELKN
jgi:hypothetical protein